MYIDDPNSTKPADWVDEEMMVDNDSSEPEDWDEVKEGKWKPPMIKNPQYKGPWQAKKMYNPKYKGVW
jgi:calreticulin